MELHINKEHKVRKSTLSVSVVAALLAVSGPLFCRPAAALDTQNNQYDSYCRNPLLEQIGDIDRSQVITINGIENPLYCTFTDAEEALTNIKIEASDILSEISSAFSLEEINANNWEEYFVGLYNLPVESEFAHDTNQQRNKLVAFFDIFENYQKNDDISSYAEQSLAKNKVRASQNDTFTLGMMLPYYAPLAQNSENTISTQRSIASTYALPNVTAAINYARQYAVNPNESEYGIAKGGPFNLIPMDCTNFVSQILEKSGVGQVVYNSDTQGWWHKNTNGKHTYSASWINADIFARYMGVGFKTTNHTEFSSIIDKGDFIASDPGNDGSWDHMGFVTDKDYTYRYYSNGDYYNYEVAQHTDNYLKWATDNGWPMKGGALGRVRR